MNREIKFRAWDSKKKKMLQDVQNYHWCENCANEYNEGTEYPAVQHFGNFVKKQYEADRFEVMQFTGLKDKNGKEIYEGDIVKFKEEGCSEYFRKSKVFFERGSFKVFDFFNSETELYDFIGNSYHLEVIGNIYENKHLLEDLK